jgi:hypothetical protein
MRLSQLAGIFPQHDKDYDSFEKSVVRSIDALDSLVGFLDDFILDNVEGEPELVKNLRSQKAVCISLRDSLRDWELGLPDHEVKR